jgi:hypothetical protein
MKNKDFVPYTEALELKKLGFDEPCLAKYTVIPEDKINWFTIPEQGITDKTSFGSSKNYNSKFFEEEGIISAPTFSQAFRFFREKYGIKHIIFAGKISTVFYGYDLLHIEEQEFVVNNSDNGGGDCDYTTYEEAELACLVALIKIVKDKT